MKNFILKLKGILLKHIPSKIKKTLKFFQHEISFNSLIEDRLFLPLTDLEGLTKDIPHEAHSINEINGINIFYGIAQTIKHYVGLPESYSLKANYTHMFYGMPWHGDLDNRLPVCLVWSDAMREEFLKCTKKPVFTVGPPIAYAPNLYSEQKILAEKYRLGRNALIFPAHSTHYIEAQFDIDALLDKARMLNEQFDSVRFCIYWKDYLSGKSQAFLESEFECVTAGHIYDPLFYSRLKALLSTADHTFGNSVGTHIGLSIGLGIPHTIFPSKIEYTKPYYTQNDKYTKNFIAFSKLFISDYSTISEEQVNVVNRYFGFSQKKSPGEFREILQTAEYLYHKN